MKNVNEKCNGMEIPFVPTLTTVCISVFEYMKLEKK